MPPALRPVVTRSINDPASMRAEMEAFAGQISRVELALVGAGRGRGETALEIPRFHACVRGSARYHLPEDPHRDLRLEAGGLLYLPPGSLCVPEEGAERDVMFFCLGADYTYAHRCSHHAGDASAHERLWHSSSVAVGDPASALCRALPGLREEGPDALEALGACVTALIRLAARRLTATSQEIVSPAEVRRRDIERYLREHYGQPITRKSVAAEFGLHPNHLSRLFHQTEGPGFSEVLTALRMEQAANLLAHTRLGVAEIARLCGQRDPATFRKAFRRYFGRPPGPR